MSVDAAAALSYLQQIQDEVDGAQSALEEGDRDALETALTDADQLIETLRVILVSAIDE